MNGILTIEMPVEVEEALRLVAASTGRSYESLALEWLSRYARASQSPRSLGDSERRAALERLRRHRGTLDSGDPDASGNQGIDTELAGEAAGSIE